MLPCTSDGSEKYTLSRMTHQGRVSLQPATVSHCQRNQTRIRIIHPRKLTCPLNRDYFNRKYIFQPSFFRGYVSFQGGIQTSSQSKQSFSPSSPGSDAVKRRRPELQSWPAVFKTRGDLQGYKLGSGNRQNGCPLIIKCHCIISFLECLLFCSL